MTDNNKLKNTKITLSPQENDMEHINKIKKGHSNFLNIYNENTNSLLRLTKEKVKIFKMQKTSEEEIEEKKKEYLLLKNRENALIRRLKDKVYYKNMFNDKKKIYYVFIGIHFLILIVLITCLMGPLNRLVAVIITIILYCFLILIYYIYIGRNKDRNYFKYNEYDVKFEQGACKFNPGSSKKSIREINQNEREEKNVKEFTKTVIKGKEST